MVDRIRGTPRSTSERFHGHYAQRDNRHFSTGTIEGPPTDCCEELTAVSLLEKMVATDCERDKETKRLLMLNLWLIGPT